MENPTGLIVSIVVIGVLIIVGIFMYGSMQDNLFYETESGTLNFLPSNTYTFSSDIVSFSAQVYNNTWIDCDGVNDNFWVVIDDSKATLSLWFKNETTDWTSIIVAGDDFYINGYLDTNWEYSPYYIDEDYPIVTYFCKDTPFSYLNVSIDEIRFYQQKLNSTQALEVYNYGR